MDFTIKNVSSGHELEKTLNLFRKIFSGMPVIDNPEYSYNKWFERMQHHGELMLYATSGHGVVGLAFGRIESDDIVIAGPIAVHEEFRGLGIAREMMRLLEARALRCGAKSIRLGAIASAENFYSKLGYVGFLLVQSQNHSVEQLLFFNKKIGLSLQKCMAG